MSEMRYDERDLRILQNSGLFKTDADTIVFARELENVKKKTYDQKTAKLNALLLFDMSTEVHPGAKTVTYRSFGSVGMAKVIANYATDFPRVDVVGEEHTVKVVGGGAAYGYSVQDQREAEMTGRPLSTMKAKAARETLDRFVNDIVFKGDKKAGVIGFLDNPNIGSYTVPADGAKSSTKFKDKTPAQILRDMNEAVTSVSKATHDIENPNTIALPPEQYRYISSTPYSDVVADSILSVFKRNNPDVNVVKANELAGAGVGDTDLMLVYVKDADHQTVEIPLPFFQHTVRQVGLEFEIPCEVRTAGLLIYYPMSMTKVAGI